MTPQEVGERGDLLIGEHLQVINLSLLVEPVLQKEVVLCSTYCSLFGQRFLAENAGRR